MTRTTQHDIPLITLSNGNAMPQLGYGVWRIDDTDAQACVTTAIECGYRSIDTAMIYENERGVGKAIRACALAREELFITTKLWNSDHHNAEAAFADSLERLGLDYVDLYLVHWPAPQTGDMISAWRSMLEIKTSGRARSIGVSNFNSDHLEAIIEDTGVVPSVNQVELHPNFQQTALREWCLKHDIVVEAWSPLGRGGPLLDDPLLRSIAEIHGKTAAQVVLRWNVQIGVVTIPKSATPSRIVENLDITDFELSELEMQQIATLDHVNGRLGPDPLTAAF